MSVQLKLLISSLYDVCSLCNLCGWPPQENFGRLKWRPFFLMKNFDRMEEWIASSMETTASY